MSLAPIHKQLMKRVLYGLYFVVLLLVGVQLFMPDQLRFLANLVVAPVQRQVHPAGEQLVIAYAFKPISLEPTHSDPITRSYLNDVYQGLVRADRGLKIEPAIAVSWGQMNPTTWIFRLRPGVKFHNGQDLKVDDVVASISRARNFDGSQLRSLLGTIQSVEAIGNDQIRINTVLPDPLLLTKLSLTYIFPSSLTDFSKPVGTGPYAFIADHGDSIDLQSFKDYWGERPSYQSVVIESIADRTERIQALEKGDVQLLGNVPPTVGCTTNSKFKEEAACSKIGSPDIVVKSVPSLEVSYIALNRNASLFQDERIRKALTMAFDRQVFVDTAYGFARPANQYVSSGVFGFNPDISPARFDTATAKQLVDDALASAFDIPEVTFDYPASLQTIGDYVKNQMTSLGIVVNLNPLSDADLILKVTSGQSDFYFLGWRSELGDASDFLKAVAHTEDSVHGYGQFNGIHYSNKKIDQLIEKSVENLDPKARLQDLQEAMKIFTVDDPYGVPLFESETIFAFNKKISFEPRVDGFIYPSEIQ